MSYGYPGQGYGPGGGGHHLPAPQYGGGYGQQPYGGYGQHSYGQQQHGGQRYQRPSHPPPEHLDQYGYPKQSSGHSGTRDFGGSGGSPPPPPSGAQQFGHGAPSEYTFQYSNCTGRRRALLIGINYYGQEGLELKGCINDVKNLSAFLVENYGYKREDMVILTDDPENTNPITQPTRENIIRAMQWLVADAQPNDALFLHYSGMPQRLPCLSGHN